MTINRLMCAISLVAIALGQKVTPVRLRPSRDFPLTPQQVGTLDGPSNRQQLRAHGWHLLDLVMADADPRSNHYRPVWYTWCTKFEALEYGFPCTEKQRRLDAKGLRRDHGRPVPRGGSKLPNITEVISDVYLSPELVRYLNAPLAQLNPSSLTLASPSKALPELLRANVHSIPDDFVGTEIAMKVAWYHVPCPTTDAPFVPVFDADKVEQVLDGDQRIDRSKLRKLYLNPSSLRGGACNPGNAAVPKGETGHDRDQFFWFQSTQGVDVTTGNGNTEYIPPGDYYVATGFHIITRERKNWVWATYWLNDRSDARGAEGRAEIIRAGKQSLFAMNITLNSNDPIFNPYLEGSLKGGAQSNCLHCHSRASVSLKENLPTCEIPHPGRSEKIPIAPDGSLTTSFLWTLARFTPNGGCTVPSSP